MYYTKYYCNTHTKIVKIKKQGPTVQQGNPMDRGNWWATERSVAKSWT